ncbi:MAG: hypothetical protein GX066_05440 [Clostridiaceae bacterium]|nr:hypothetical protein [Clostridiaceae bacterium]
MEVSSIPRINYYKADFKTSPKAKENIEEVKDEYIPGQRQTKAVTYERPSAKVDWETIKRLKEESDRIYSHLKQMVAQLLEKQGMTFQEAITIEVDEETRLEAASLIGEGGPLSPEKVSDRIVEFAKAISGGDKEKLGILRSAIEEGFREAAKVLGGKLPEISIRTYELVMEKLDKWEQEDQE